MRALLVWLAVACACEGGRSLPDARRTSCEVTNPCTADLCGNGRIDTCMRTMNSSCAIVTVTEACDGDIPSCASLGYYGGSATCNSCRAVDERTCDVCAPTASCGMFASLGAVSALSVSGSRVALVGASGVAIYEGLTEIARVPIANVSGIAPTAAGWLLATTNSLSTLSADGVRGEVRALAAGPNPRLAAGPDGRVIVAWVKPAGSPAVIHAFSAIADADANIVVDAIDHGAIGNVTEVSVTSDGTSFFIGTSGRLFRVAADGTSTITTGFPATTSGDAAAVTWSGTTGWYVQNANGYLAQRFDANGALVGGPIAIGVVGAVTFQTFFADGDVLRAVIAVPLTISRFSLIPITAAGANGNAQKEVGIRSTTSSVVATPIGPQVLVAWNRPTSLHLALVTP